MNSIHSVPRAGVRQHAGRALGVLLLGLLAGCQGASQDAISVGPPQAAQASRSASSKPKPQELFGSGPVRVGLITALLASVGESKRERDIRDGAVLAVDELGGGQLSLQIENTDGSAEQVREAAKRLADQGAKLVAVSSEVRTTGMREGMRAEDVPILVLSGAPTEAGNGSFSFVSDHIDSAIEGASYAAAAGRKRLVVLLPAGIAAAERQRLDRGLAGHGIKPVLTADAASVSGDASARAKLKDIDAVVIIGAGEAEVGSLSALRANGHLAADAMVVGSSQWTTASYGRSELARSHLCLFGPESGSRMTASFRQRYERTADLDAAYGFDIVALAAGLVRTQGESGINRQALMSPNGFLGAAAAFRFEKDGSVLRTCAVYQIVDGKLSLVDPAPRSF
ncbi:ABC transporter substrate-binding protein [Sinorhizobium alkalisoli]|uniref:ABC transporter substrate-binding protein n=1 Tax=Sinorhizobium alkalisoli TaxID=1752398 RepID=UPI00124E0741|nr:ABC transporter substrate-binding protein [Sinorhizobium alkalisoli]